MGWAHEASSDESLVVAVGEQSREALGEIYRRHGGTVWSVVKRVCSRVELVEEVCEAVFAELWSHPERFDPARGTLRSWLLAQAHRRAVDRTRAGGARLRLVRHDRAGTTAPSAEVEVTEHAAALTKEARRAIDQLATAERDAILLAYVGGHAYSETARLLGTTEGTVKDHIRRGLLNLRRALEAEGVTR
jgi:RNA polymerase sigma-70 factor, ECF subfamily